MGVAMTATIHETKYGLTEEQLRRRRNEDWRIDHDEGRYDPAYGCKVRRSLDMIADLYGVGKTTVWDGITAARRVREAIAREETI